MTIPGVGARKNKQKQRQKQRQRQGQRRNTGISPLRRQSAPPSVEMTFVMGGRCETNNSKDKSRSLRDDKQKDNSNRNCKSNGRFRGRTKRGLRGGKGIAG